MQLVYVKSEGEKQTLGFDVHRPSCQEALESIVPLQDPKYTLGLNGTVHPKQNPFLACNIRKTLGSVAIKGLRHLNSLGVFSSVTCSEVGTAVTAFTFINLAGAFESGSTDPVPVFAVGEQAPRLAAVGILVRQVVHAQAKGHLALELAGLGMLVI